MEVGERLKVFTTKSFGTQRNELTSDNSKTNLVDEKENQKPAPEIKVSCFIGIFWASFPTLMAAKKHKTSPNQSSPFM